MQDTVLLEMTYEEAEFLRDLTGHVTGITSLSRRKHANRVNEALTKALGEQTIFDLTGLVHTEAASPAPNAPCECGACTLSIEQQEALDTDDDDDCQCCGCITGDCEDC